jgi:hypothetical protein
MILDMARESYEETLQKGIEEKPASLLKRETRFTRRRKGGAGVPPAMSGDTPDTTLTFGLSFVKDFFSRCGARSTWLALCHARSFSAFRRILN